MLGASTALAGLVAFDAAAGPQDGQVVAGQAAIQQAGGGRTNVIQTTDRAIIDWRGFSIGAGEHVDFQQPGAGSVTLNRVTGAQSSLIDGRLTATGNVFIINPNGVIFGKGASVDVGGLVATTANLSNANFMAGRYLFDQASTVAGASVVNEGSISVREGGLAALVAPTVRNSGVITARLGRVVLAGAETATVDLYGDGLFAFDTGVSTAVTHDGGINADGGSVLLTTAQAKGVVDGAISMGGTVTARSVEKQGGKIILKGAGSVAVAGTLDASGKAAGQAGGEVKVLGDQVALQATARVDVSGDQGGGTALIGGNVQGNGSEQRATDTLISGGALINADAITAGKGGTVVVWADNYTQFDGTITARGGARGGDGGFVETSGKKALGIQKGRVDASAEKGKSGQWLLDPRNVEIANTGDTFTGGTYTPTADNAKVDAAAIQAALDTGTNGTDVTITTGTTGTQDGNITTTAGVTWSKSSKLTLNAAGSITLSQDFTGTAGALTLIAGTDINQTAGRISVATLSAGAGGAVSLTQANEVVTLGNFSAGGNFTFNDATDGLTVTGNNSNSTAGLIAITTAGGALNLQGSIAGTGVELTGAGVSLAAGITVSGGSGAIVLDGGAGTLTLGAGTLVLGTGSIALSADSMAIDAAAQVGGSAAGAGAATTVTLTGSTAGRSIGIAGGSGDLALSEDALAAVRATNGVIGTAASGAVTFADWTPAATFASGSLTVNGNAGVSFAGAVSLAGSLTLNPGGAVTQSAGTLTVAGDTTVNAAGFDVTLDQAGNDFQGGFGGSMAALSLKGGAIEFATLSAASIDLIATGTVIQSGDLAVTGDTTIAAGSNTITLAGTANTFGAAVSVTGGTVTITDTGTLRIGGTTGALTITSGALTFDALTAASLDVTAAGAINQNSGITVTGTTTITAGGNTVTLDDAGNNFGGAVSVTGAGAVSLRDAGAIALATIDAGSLTVQAGGNISQPSGTLTIAGTTALSTTSGTISVIRSDNDFSGTVNASATGTVSIRDSGDLTVGNVAGTAIGLTANGTLTQAAGTAITATSAAATSTLNAGSGSIALDNAGNDFAGAVNLAATTAVSLRDGTDGLQLGNVTAGALTVRSAGALTQTGAGTITVTGTASLTADSVTLANTGNNFAGTVTVSSTGDVSLRDTNAITLGDITAAAFTLQAGGDVTQAAGASVQATGATSITAGSGAITLDASANSFGGTLSLSGSGAVIVAAAGGIAFGDVAAASLDITATGGLSQTSGTLSVTGATSLEADAITLTASGNDFGGAVTITGTTVSLTDTNALTLGTVGAGSLTINAGGALTQAAATSLQITGNSSFTAAGITLTRAGNIFGDTVTANGGASAVSIAADADLKLGSVSGSGLTATAGGELRLTGTVSTIGAISLTANSVVQESGATIATGGTITVTADDMALTGTGSITTGSTVTLRARTTARNIRLGSAAAGSLSLSDAELNAISGASSLTVGQAGATGTITVNQALNLTGNAGNLTLSGGAITLGQSITTAGNITFTAAATLSGAGSTLSAGGNVVLTSVNAATDGGQGLSIAATGTVSLGAIGNSARLASLTVSGTTITMAAGAATTGAQDYTGTVAISGDAAFTTDNASFSVSGGIRGAGGGRDLSIDIGTGTLSVGSIGAGTAVGAFSATAGSVAFTSIAATGDVTLNAMTGGASIGTLSHGAGNVVVTADSIDLGGIWTGSGTRTVRPSSTGRSLTIGASATDFELTAVELAFLGNGTPSAITIGRADGTGAVSLNSVSFDDTLTIQGGTTRLESGATLSWANANTLTIASSGDILLQGMITGAAGSLVLTAAGDVRQETTSTIFGFLASPITVATLSATAGGAIDLDGPFFLTANAIGRLDLSAGGTVSYLGRDGLTLGNISGTSLSITGVSSITQTAGTAISVAGTSSLVASGTVTLTQAGNDFGGAVSVSGGAVTLADTGALQLGNITATSFDLTIGGALTQAAGTTLTVTGTTKVTSNGADITLDRSTNNFGGAITIVAGGATAVADQNDLQLGAVTATTLTVDAQGQLSQSASTAITVAGATVLSAAGITLANTGNDFQDTVTAGGGGAVSLTDKNALVLGTVSAASLTIATAGALTQTGDITVTGATGITTGGNAVTLDRSNNDFQNTVAISAGAVTIADKNALVLGQTGAASLTLTALGAVNQTGDITITGATTILAGGNAVTLDRSNNDFRDTVTITGGAVTLADKNALVLGAVTAASLDLTAGGAVTQDGDIAVAGTANLAAGTAAITLDRAGNTFGGAVAVSTSGAVSLRDADALRVGGSTGALTLVSGGALAFDPLSAASLNVTAGGGVGQTGTLTVTGASVIEAGGATVALDDAGNNFGGAVSITTTGTVSLRDINAITFGNVTAGGFSVLAGGSIAQASGTAIGATGAVDLASTAGNINLRDLTAASLTAEATGTITQASGSVTTTGAVNLTTDGDVALRGLSAGSLTIGGAAISQASGTALDIDAATILTAAGNISLRQIATGSLAADAAGSITQAAGAITATGAVSLSSAGGNITLRDIAATGNLTVTTTGTGAITQATGVLDIDGASVLASGSGAITLDRSGNDFGGAVTASTTGDVSIRDANALMLGAIAAANLTVRSAGNLTQAGGTAVTAADTSLTAGTGAITFANAGNDFTGTVTVSTTGATSLRDGSGGLVLGTVATGALTLDVAGTLTQTAGTAVSATGLASLTAEGITLANAGNNFAAAVSVSSSADVALRDSGALTLGTVTAAALSLQTGGTLAFGTTTAASLSVTAGGAVSQTGDIAVTGTTGVNATGQAITLNRTGNNFGDTVTLTGSTVAISDADALKLTGNTGALTIVSGALTLDALNATALTISAGGAVGQTADLTVTGATSITAAGNAVTLDRSGNDFQGAVTVTGAAVSIADATALTFGGSTGALTLASAGLTLNATSAASLSVTSSGTIGQGTSGSLAVTGATVLDAGSNAVTLTRAGNDFGGSVTVSAGNVSITDANALQLIATASSLTVTSGALTLDAVTAASLTVTASGPVSQTAALVVNGATSISAGAGAVVLDDAGNNFGGTVAVSTSGAVVLRDVDAILLGALGAGSLSVQAGGTLAQASATAINATGAVALNAGGDIALRGITAGSLDVSAAGGITFATGTSINVAGAASVSAAGSGIDLATLSAGSLSLTAGGDVTQTGQLSVTGIVTVGAAGFNVTLTKAGNAVGGFAVTANNVALADTGATQLGAGMAAGNFSLLTTGAVTQNSALFVAGTTSITTAKSGAGSVTLDRADNTFTGAVSLTGGPAVIRTSGALTIASADTAGALALSGNGIGQTGAIAVTGLLTLAPGTGAIALTNAANSIKNLAILSASSAEIVTTQALVLGTVTVAGDLFVTAGGAITQTGDVMVGGTANFSTTANSDITLSRSGNDFTVFTAANARNIAISDANALELGPISASGTVTLDTEGAITQSGALVADRLAGQSGAAAIFDDAGNVIGSLGAFTAGGDLTVVSGAATFEITDTAAGTGDVALIAGATGGLLSVKSGAKIKAGGTAVGDRDVLLQGDDIELAAAIAGSGNVTLQSTTRARNITIGDAKAGELSLTDQEILRLTDGHKGIFIGRGDGSGRIDIQSATFNDPVTFRAPETGGSVKLNGSLKGKGDASFMFMGSGATTTLNGSISTAGQAIIFNDAVVLASTLPVTNQAGRQNLPTAIIDTTDGGAAPTGANVTFMKGVDASTSFVEGIDIYAGTKGDVLFMDDIGANVAVGRLRIFSGANFTAEVDKLMTRILDIEVSGVALARNVTAKEELVIRGTGGRADLTLSEVRDFNDFRAAFFVRRPDGVGAEYRINGCIMATTCGMDNMLFTGLSLPPYRDDPDVGVRGIEGSLGSPAMRSPRLISASVNAPSDDFSIQYSSPADRELW